MDLAEELFYRDVTEIRISHVVLAVYSRHVNREPECVSMSHIPAKASLVEAKVSPRR